MSATVVRPAYPALIARLTGAAVVIVCGSHVASAQTLLSCQPRYERPSLGLAVAVNATNSRLHSGILGSDHNQPMLIRNGPGFSAKGTMPVGSRFGVELSYGRSALGVERELAPGTVTSPTAEVGRSIAASEVTVGIIRRLTPTARRACGYAGAKVGLYRFALDADRSRASGIAGMFGVDLQLSVGAAAFVEVQVTAIMNDSQRPLNAVVVPIASIGAGLRYRFP